MERRVPACLAAKLAPRNRHTAANDRHTIFDVFPSKFSSTCSGHLQIVLMYFRHSDFTCSMSKSDNAYGSEGTEAKPGRLSCEFDERSGINKKSGFARLISRTLNDIDLKNGPDEILIDTSFPTGTQRLSSIQSLVAVNSRCAKAKAGPG